MTKNIKSNTCITLGELRIMMHDLCDLDDKTKIFISQHSHDTISEARNIIADKDSINIYDWI